MHDFCYISISNVSQNLKNCTGKYNVVFEYKLHIFLILSLNIIVSIPTRRVWGFN